MNGGDTIGFLSETFLCSVEAGLEVGDQGKGFGHNLLETMMVTWIKVVAGRVESRQICVAFRK